MAKKDFDPSVAKSYAPKLTALKKLIGKKVAKEKLPFTNGPLIVLKKMGHVSGFVNGKATVFATVSKLTSEQLAAGVRAYWRGHYRGRKVKKKAAKRKYVRKVATIPQDPELGMQEQLANNNALLQSAVSTLNGFEARISHIESLMFRLVTNRGIGG